MNPRLTCICKLVTPIPVLVRSLLCEHTPATKRREKRRLFLKFSHARRPCSCFVLRTWAEAKPHSSPATSYLTRFSKRLYDGASGRCQGDRAIKKCGGLCNNSSNRRYRPGFRGRYHRRTHPLP